jgi:hypothetical protein
MGSRTTGWSRPGVDTGLRQEPAQRGLYRALSQIPTLFGTLVYVASLRDSVAGRYSHTVFEGVLDVEEADRALCNIHHQVFSRWLTLGLEEQKNDLAEYLKSPGISEAAFHYSNLIPAASRDVERQLYITDLETVLELLRFERNGGRRAPGS